MLNKVINKLSGLGSKKKLFISADRKLEPTLSPHIVCAAIASSILDRKPFLACRFGWFETFAIGHYDLNGSITDAIMHKMWNTPGIFPPTESAFVDFYSEYTKAMASADILGLMHCPHEASVVTRHAPQAYLCMLQDLEPYYNPIPWSKYLAGLTVLVVNPFVDSIESQYSQFREKLFFEPDILPQFKLIKIKPPQTLCGNTSGFESWNAALLDLKTKISDLKFDVAIVGCGAYGLPISSFIKESGIPCIQLGGATQTLFGVFGERWIKNNPVKYYINKYWKRPDESERPNNWQDAERGCYW